LILASGLAISSYMQVRAGLRPLQVLRQHVADLRQGHIRRLTGNQPSEVQPLIDEINALLEDNEAIIERARTHTGNLAHALKTPLSGLLNEVTALETSVEQKLRPSLDALHHTIQHHLEKARLAARSEARAYQCDLAVITNSLLRIFTKTTPHLQFKVVIEDELPWFAGEEQDALDIIGNIVENAAKWASHDIHISLTSTRQPLQKPILNIAVDDDGPGLDEEQRRKLGQRGLRLDETKPGSGLGLSIVRDVLATYKATWSLQKSPLGGLRVCIHLPAVSTKTA
jgi:signal transduction histidine kinase